MIKIQPIRERNIIYMNGQNKLSSNKENDHHSRDAVLGALTAAGLLILGGVIYKSKFRKNKNESLHDIKYLSNIIKSADLKGVKEKDLRSLAGGEEYKKIVEAFSDIPKAYTPGRRLITDTQDNYILTGVQSKNFRVSLHNHTIYSDGKMQVKELLNQAADYADKVAVSLKDDSIAKNAPFTIAITDHDTLEGCREAVKILSSNPDKYRHLKVVLGVELTVENRMLSDKLKKPVQNHFVLNGINPFDRELNEFLSNKKKEKVKVGKKFFNRCKDEIAKTNKEFADTLSWAEAKQTNAIIKNGLIYPWYSIRDYIAGKLELFDGQNRDDIMKTVCRIQKGYEPKMELPSYSTDIEDVIDFMKDKDGYFTLAHPALINIGECLKNREESIWAIKELIKLLKQKGKDKILAAEVHYPYFGEVGASSEWLRTISEAVNKEGMLASGGLDSHGKNIFYSNK